VTHNDKGYYYLKARYHNPSTRTFVGSITIKFNFSVYPYTISEYSFEVYDQDNSCYLDSEEFVFQGSSLLISQDVVGNVEPNGARTFEVYFLFMDEDVLEELSTDTAGKWLRVGIIPDIPILGNLQVFHFVFLIGLVTIYLCEKTNKEKKIKRWRPITGICIIVLVLSLFAYL
jgi:hypothetical protein